MAEFGEIMKPDDNATIDISPANNYTFVNFTSGSCGEFLITLIILMHNKHRRDKMHVSDEGSCHSNRILEPEIINSWTPEYLDEFIFELKCNNLLANLANKDFAKFTNLDTITPVCKSHLEINKVPKLMLNYPDTSLIQIVPDDADQVARNVIFKTLLPELERAQFGGDDLVLLLTKLGLPITDDISSVTSSEFDQVYNMIKLRHAELEIAKLEKVKLNSELTSSNYYEINFSEIMSNKKSLFFKLNDITGFPITKEALGFYDMYIEKQPTLNNIIDFRSKLKQD